MAFLRKLLGFCCCGPTTPPVDCTVSADNFNRTDSTTIGGEFTETTGDSTITSNRLQFTTTSAKATCITDSPSPERSIVAKARASTANNLARVWCGDWIIEVKFSTTAGSVKLINPGGTTITTSATDLNLALNTDYIIEVCYDGDSLEANIDGVDRSYVEHDAAITDLTNGLGTGGTVSGSVAFDDWELSELDGDDCTCPITRGGDQGCPYCTSATGPYYWLIEVAGIANTPCTNCPSFNRAYIATPSTNNNCAPVVDNTSCCCWLAPTSDAGVSCTSPTATRHAQVSLQVCKAYDAVPTSITARMFATGTGGGIHWRQTYGSSPIDCLGVAGLVLPVIINAGTFCDGSLSTATATAL